MPRSKRRQVIADYHKFLLAPEDAELNDLSCLGDLVDATGPAIVVRTGVQCGFVWVSVRASRSAPQDLAEAVTSGGWDLGEEVELDIEKPLDLYGFMSGWDEVYPAEFVPGRPGPHRVRVLAKGPRDDDAYPAGREVILEEYLVQIWPVD